MTDKTVMLKLPNGREYPMIGALTDGSIIGLIEKHGGFYEPHVMHVISQFVKPDFVCMDIGANVGVLTLAMAQAAQQGKIFAIECAAQNYDYLLKNMQQHKVVNCVPIRYGVGDKRQRVELNYLETRAGCSFVSPMGVEAGVKEYVDMKTIDEICTEYQLEHVNFIKLDVEGGERQALLGAQKLLAKSRPILLIEFNPHPIQRFYGEDPKDLFKLLAELYPYIYLINCSTGDLKLIKSYDELMGMITDGKGWEDLLCMFHPISLYMSFRYALSQKISKISRFSQLPWQAIWRRIMFGRLKTTPGGTH